MPDHATCAGDPRSGRDRPAGASRLLAGIDAALAAPGPGRFTPELERQYGLRQGPVRRQRLARALRLLALGMLAALGLDLANGRAHIAAYALTRAGVVIACLAAARLLGRVRRPWAEHLLYGLPVLCAMLGTEVMGEWSDPHYADRYMMAAAIVPLVGLAVAPVGLLTGRLVALLAAGLFPLVPVLLPGSLTLAGNADIPCFAWGALAMASLLVRINAVQTRTAFLHTLRHELVAAEMTLLNAELLRLSGTDALTGLPNRRTFDSELQRLWTDERAAGLGLALIDVDRFKTFNDTAGHQAGDACLQAVAQVITRTLWDQQRVARYGGEEFAVLWACDGSDLAATGERLRAAVASAALPNPGLGGAVVTISVGLSWRSRSGCGRAAPSELVRAADAALYEAKKAGRNRIAVRAMPPEPHPAGVPGRGSALVPPGPARPDDARRGWVRVRPDAPATGGTPHPSGDRTEAPAEGVRVHTRLIPLG